jgi:predicted enzyme related to lactoylglutathione lyase
MSTETPSRIVAPAMRFVPVSDPARSIAFYRDVLGFVEQQLIVEYGVDAVAELALGPARIQLYPQTKENCDRLILFFETDDVVALREAIVARGGQTSSLQKVNWIKMEMTVTRYGSESLSINLTVFNLLRCSSKRCHTYL